MKPIMITYNSHTRISTLPLAKLLFALYTITGRHRNYLTTPIDQVYEAYHKVESDPQPQFANTCIIIHHSNEVHISCRISYLVQSDPGLYCFSCTSLTVFTLLLDSGDHSHQAQCSSASPLCASKILLQKLTNV